LKFLLYVFYFFRSVFSRGLLNTLRLLQAEMREEKHFGIQTSAIKKSDSAEFHHYQGASYLVLQRLFSELPETLRDFDFMDIGCGKGRVVFVAEHAGFDQLSGIELDPELLQVARENESRYVFKRNTSMIRFIHANALEYEYKDQPTVYFLFNPFNEMVLRAVLAKIRASTHSETWFIYMNPLFPAPFAEQHSEMIREVKTWRYCEAVIYCWPGTQLI
jgi:SAM-dependent methyltransferase